jgi:hypothetical protein
MKDKILKPRRTYKGLTLKRRRVMMSSPCGRAFLIENGYARRPRGKKRLNLNKSTGGRS